jgi:hypothetical protein
MNKFDLFLPKLAVSSIQIFYNYWFWSFFWSQQEEAILFFILLQSYLICSHKESNSHVLDTTHVT